MNENGTTNQLAAEMASLRRQLEQVTQRLDMIYGAITRLAEARDGSPAGQPHPGPQDGQAREEPAASPSLATSARMVMDPGSMLASLHQYALKAGLDVSPDVPGRLKSELTGDS